MPARILVIENNPANRELMGCLLKMFGYTLLVASEAAAGLAAARRVRPDLIICDTELPGISGYEFARQIRTDPYLGDIPLVALTAFAVVGDRGKALEAGFDTYLFKPIDPDTFVEEVAALLPPGQALASPLPAAAAFSGVRWKA
jgi:two-component system cell cycle response regulator